MSVTDSSGLRLWIVVPAYQEERALGSVLTALAPWMPQVIVVDDGSQDDTSGVARRAGAVVLRHSINIGQGAALQTGIDFALARGATHVCTFDADGQHDPTTIHTMLAALEDSGADIALGSRFLGEAVN